MTQIELGPIESANIETLRKGIATGGPTATIRAVAAMYTADANFRDDVNAAAKRNNVDKDGRLNR